MPLLDVKDALRSPLHVSDLSEIRICSNDFIAESDLGGVRSEPAEPKSNNLPRPRAPTSIEAFFGSAAFVLEYIYKKKKI